MLKELTLEQRTELLDKRQKALCEVFPDSPFLNTPRQIARTLSWLTFYRRNLDVFAAHYLGLHLYPYQKIMLHELGVHGTSVIVAARASAKTFTTGIFACSHAILYPGHRILVVSATKEQAGILVREKIQGELMHSSSVLVAEIESIRTGKNDTRVEFKNGSIIEVVVGDDRARGHHADIVIIDEFRMTDKQFLDNVIEAMCIAQAAPFNRFPEYENVSDPAGFVYISSAWYCSHWMWPMMQKTLATYLENDSDFFMCLDYSVCLRHKIKTREMLRKSYEKLDLMSWQIEYQNYMIRENTHAFFTFDELDRCRTLHHQFYPRQAEDVLSGVKNKHAIPRQSGEVRILACDIAMVDRAGNDNSCFVCIRLLPEWTTNGDGVAFQQNYRRQVPYLEAFPGCETNKQAIRIKQLYEDFDADYCVLDVRNAGISVYDALAKILYDEERNKEYAPWTCFNDDVIAARVPIMGAKHVVYAINASAKFNSEIATTLRNAFQSKRVELLISFDEAADDLRRTIPQYFNATDADVQVFYERPYYETTALINEMIGLEYSVSPQTKLITIHEVGKATKDRYTALAYGNAFGDMLERDLLSNKSAYKCMVLIN